MKRACGRRDAEREREKKTLRAPFAPVEVNRSPAILHVRQPNNSIMEEAEEIRMCVG